MVRLSFAPLRSRQIDLQPIDGRFHALGYENFESPIQPSGNSCGAKSRFFSFRVACGVGNTRNLGSLRRRR